MARLVVIVVMDARLGRARLLDARLMDARLMDARLLDARRVATLGGRTSGAWAQAVWIVHGAVLQASSSSWLSLFPPPRPSAPSRLSLLVPQFACGAAPLQSGGR